MATKAVTWTTKTATFAPGTKADGFRVSIVGIGATVFSQSLDVPANGPALAVFSLDPGDYEAIVQRLNSDVGPLGDQAKQAFSIAFPPVLVSVPDVVSVVDQ